MCFFCVNQCYATNTKNPFCPNFCHCPRIELPTFLGGGGLQPPAPGSYAHDPTSLGPPARQVLQRSLPLLANRNSMPTPLCAHRGRNLGPCEHVSLSTVCQSGKKDLLTSGDEREGAFLFQTVSVLLQRYNAVLLHK